MAQTIDLQNAKVVGTISGNSPEVGYFPEAAGQSFKSGQFVYLNNGKVTACADDATVILGLAVHDASGVEDQDVAVHLANEDTIFEMNVYYDGDGDADDAVDITQVGGEYALVVVSNKCHVDISDTSNKAFLIRRISPRDSAGDIYGRVHLQVLASAAQL